MIKAKERHVRNLPRTTWQSAASPGTSANDGEWPPRIPTHWGCKTTGAPGRDPARLPGPPFQCRDVPSDRLGGQRAPSTARLTRRRPCDQHSPPSSKITNIFKFQVGPAASYRSDFRTAHYRSGTNTLLSTIKLPSVRAGGLTDGPGHIPTSSPICPVMCVRVFCSAQAHYPSVLPALLLAPIA